LLKQFSQQSLKKIRENYQGPDHPDLVQKVTIQSSRKAFTTIITTKNLTKNEVGHQEATLKIVNTNISKIDTLITEMNSLRTIKEETNIRSMIIDIIIKEEGLEVERDAE
jgi:hypothetical protein